MPGRQVVVDGSNIATEGRSLPSLSQLDQAVRAYQAEHSDDKVIVVVDATFGHRIDPSERRAFEEAEAAGELVSPPAGAIGRGDRFLLQIADRTGATVLSNDSFQEFHGEYGWLFDEGRLIGGKPVPGIGWIFTPRTPVRGPKSRESVKEAKRKKKADVPEPEHGLEQAAKAKESKPKTKKQVDQAIATATDEAVEGDGARKRRRRRRGSAPPAEPVNDPGLFFAFVTSHPLGSHVTGRIDTFASHGAFVTVDETRCYIPLSAMGDPPPRAAKEVLNRGEDADFVAQAFDPSRRGIELALPAFAHLAGRPTDETVEAEITEAQVHERAEDEGTAAAKPRRRTKKAAPAEAAKSASPAPRPARKRA